MSNTVYILQKDGSYKKVSYIEKEIHGNLTLTKDILPIGATGSDGKDGHIGRDGKNGRDGINGEMGLQGSQGEIGLRGERGEVGKDGYHGLDGYTPIKGVDYFDGQNGIQGLKGDQGDMGSQGPIGLRGEQGPIGLRGEQGIKGRMGLKGDTGEKGDWGPRGFAGETGQIGPTGATGPRGWKGDPGPRGMNGVGGRGPQGIAGPTGPAGSGGGGTASTISMLSGTFSGSTMIDGPPLYKDITFGSVFVSDYIVTIDSDSPRDWSTTNKTTGGFRIDSNSTSTLNEVIYWSAQELSSGNFGYIGPTGATGPSVNTKNGVISGASFSGTQLSYSIVFDTPYTTNYSMSVVGDEPRTWSVSSKTNNGFTIDSNSSVILVGDIYYTTIEIT